MSFNYLPGVQVNTVDGNLLARRTPRTKSVLVLGTASKGPVSGAYQVQDRATAATVFGFDGTLIKAMEEAASASDNILLFRIGTKPAVLADIGASGAQAGISITFGERVSTVDTLYRLWYDSGVLHVWKGTEKVYSNDPSNAIDSGDLTVTVPATAPTGGLFIGASGTDAEDGASYDNAATVNYAVSALEEEDEPLTFTAAVTGVETDFSKRDLYVALEKAFDLLGNFTVQEVYAPGTFADNENVAFYVSGDATTAAHNPATNADALDWLKVLLEEDGTFQTDDFGDKIYHWAGEEEDSAGNEVEAATFLSAEDRLEQGYHEVNFAYQLARFCAKQEETNTGCLGFIGVRPPTNNKYDLVTLREWIGYLPTYSASDNSVTVSGKGLLGIPFLVGTTAAKLNALASYRSPYRSPGLFKTLNWAEFDDVVEYDKNQNPVDIGAYIHVVGDYGYMANSYGSYPNSLAGIVAGMLSALDEKSAATNKVVAGVSQLHRPSLGQLDALTQAGINMLRFKGAGQRPVLLHGMTAANPNSDFKNMLRQRIKFLVVDMVRIEADKFIGEGTIDGLQLQALRTALDAKFVELQKRGYLSRYSYTISTTEVDQRVGRAFIDINFYPADELVQLRATVGVSRS